MKPKEGTYEIIVRYELPVTAAYTVKASSRREARNRFHDGHPSVTDLMMADIGISSYKRVVKVRDPK